MSSFTEFSAPLTVRYDAEASKALGADHWRVTEGVRFYLAADHNAWVTVPAGYLTDGASVPRALWSLIPPWGAYGQAAVVHDLVCEYLSVTVDGKPKRITRAACDDILFEALVVLDVPEVQRQAIYQAVCAFRLVSGVDKPTSTALKRKLESEWGG